MVYERFVSQSENDEIVKNTFTIFGYSIVSIIITLLLLWGYNSSANNQFLFIIVYSLIMILYTVVIISIVVMEKNKYESTSYTIIFGSTIFMIFLAFFIGVFSIYKFFTTPSSSAMRNEQVLDYTYRR
jgi:cytochrome bd-type quinol oxidase subunit 2